MAATAFKEIWLNWLLNSLQQSMTNQGEFVLPDWYKYQAYPFRVFIIEPDPSAPIPTSRLVSVAPLTLKMTINDTLDDASPLVEQSTWASDTALNKFEGVLDLNTPGMAAYVGSASSVQAYFQIEVSQSGATPTPIYQRLITIKNSVTQPTTTSPDVTKTYRTAEESDGLYLTGKNRPGVQIGIVSPAGTKVRWIGVDDNGTRFDDVEDNIP